MPQDQKIRNYLTFQTTKLRLMAHSQLHTCNKDWKKFKKSFPNIDLNGLTYTKAKNRIKSNT